MKKIVLTLLCATIALSLFLVPSSALTATNTSYPNDGTFGSLSYIGNVGSYSGKLITIPIVVSGLRNRYFTTANSTSLVQRYSSGVAFGGKASRITILGLPAVYGDNELGEYGSSDVTINGTMCVQYSASYITDNYYNSPDAIILVPSFASLDWSVRIILEDFQGQKSSFIFAPDAGVYQLTYGELYNIITSNTSRISFELMFSVNSADLWTNAGDGYVYQLDYYVPNAYEYSTLNDDLNRYLDEIERDEAYQDGLNAGYQDGYGQAINDWESTHSVFDWVSSAVTNLMNTPIAPGFSIGIIFTVILGVLIFKAILAMIGGG